MSSVCLNCTRLAKPGEEYCAICLNRLDEMVDNRELSGKDPLEMQDDLNPFWSTTQTTGRVSDAQSVRVQVEKDNESTSGYFYAVLIIVFFLFLLVAVYL